MADRPVIFSGPMVKALLEGRKSQTRRILKSQPPEWVTRMCHEGRNGWIGSGDGHGVLMHVPYAVGDRLWVREAFRGSKDYDAYPPREWSHWPVHYEADGAPDPRDEVGENGKLRSPIHMPRWASRLTLTVTDVRVERLQEISEADAQAEGFPISWDGKPYDPPSPQEDSWQGYGRASMSLYWNSIHVPGAWDANPWVCAISFTVDRANIDRRE